MARTRNLKPGFFENETLAETGPLGQLLFEGLWGLADREGRLEDRPLRIKARVFPYYDADVDALLNALADRGFVLRYAVGSARYIQVVNFTKHQTPHKQEAASTIPAPDKHQTSTDEAPDGIGLNTRSLLLELELEPGTTGSGECEGADAPAADAAPPKTEQPVRAVPKPKRTAAPIAADWQPPPELVGWAKRDPPDGLGLPAAFVRSEIERFRDYWLGTGGKKADWVATWRAWMRKEEQEGRRAIRNGKPQSETGLVVDSAQYKGDKYLTVKGRI